MSTRKKAIKQKEHEKPASSISVKEYAQTLWHLKQLVQEAQIKAALCVNIELLKLYWSIGKIIAEKQEAKGWGFRIVERLAKDLQNEFPGIEGFSRTNIFRMQAFLILMKK